MELEKLLNKLIEKGWRPFGFIVQNIRKWPYDSRYYFFENCAGWKSLRELVSKESGLWQFCCENKMIRKDRFTWMISPDPFWEDQYNYIDYRYRLIETSLKNEDDLEEFLLENIEVDVENN